MEWHDGVLGLPKTNIHFEEREFYDNYEGAWLFYTMNTMVLQKNVMGWNTEMYDLGRDSYTDTHLLWFKDGKQ